MAVLSVLVPAAAHAQTAAEAGPPSDDSLRVSIGATYAEGRYGQTAQTRVATVPVSVKYTHSRFSVKVTVPYVHIQGPGTLLDGTGSGASGSGASGSGSASSEVSEQEIEAEAGGTGAVIGPDTGTSEGESAGLLPGAGAALPILAAPMRNRGGLGDTTVTLAYALPISTALSLESRGRVKLPTASSRKGIGTGKVDVTLAADLVGTFGTTTVYAGARRRFLGRTTRFALRDGWGFGGGASHQLSPSFTIGADYDWLQSATPARGPISEGSVWASLKLNPKFRLQVYAGKGFSSRRADGLGGLSLVWRP